MNNTIKYFPFSPGIPWKIKRNKYIIPEIKYELYNKIIKNKNIVTLCFGGFFESYFSLFIIEALNDLSLSNKIYFKGDSRFNYLVHSQGIASIFPYDLNKDFGFKYPAPLFLDDSNNVYVNCLNDYIIARGFKGTGTWPVKRPVTKQIFTNSMLNWDEKFPIFRNEENIKFLNWCKLYKFHYRKPYAFILPFETGLSNHNVSCLNWSIYDIKKFAAMVKQYINVVVCTKTPELFLNSDVYAINVDVSLIVSLLQNCSFLLSKEVDYILCALCMNKYVFSEILEKPFDIESNLKFLGVQRD